MDPPCGCGGCEHEEAANSESRTTHLAEAAAILASVAPARARTSVRRSLLVSRSDGNSGRHKPPPLPRPIEAKHRPPEIF